MSDVRVTDEYARRGIDAVHLENEHLRVEVLAGKGGDVTEIRDKRTDENVLFENPAEWHAPGDGYVGAASREFDYMDHYPGGWQDVLPVAGGPSEAAGAPFALHGESAIAPWEAEVREDEDAAAVDLSVSLTRYPLDVERRIELRGGESRLRVSETVTNRGEVGVDYSWLQHVALGGPLVGPGAELEVPAETVLVDPDSPGGDLPRGGELDWPVADLPDGEWDFRAFPDRERRVHEVCAVTDLREGRYTVRNPDPDVDLGVTVTFPADRYEYLWYWQAFGGFTEAPFFGRNYNAGLEPCTSVPNAGLEEQLANGTANHLEAGEDVSATVTVRTHEP